MRDVIFRPVREKGIRRWEAEVVDAEAYLGGKIQEAHGIMRMYVEGWKEKSNRSAEAPGDGILFSRVLIIPTSKVRHGRSYHSYIIVYIWQPRKIIRVRDSYGVWLPTQSICHCLES